MPCRHVRCPSAVDSKQSAQVPARVPVPHAHICNRMSNAHLQAREDADMFMPAMLDTCTVCHVLDIFRTHVHVPSVLDTLTAHTFKPAMLDICVPCKLTAQGPLPSSAEPSDRFKHSPLLLIGP